MASFNIRLWQKLQEDFLDGKVYFGIAPEDTQAPYCVIHVLDSGDNEGARTLCGDTTGEAEIQFSIYSTNSMQLDDLLVLLNATIKSYSAVDDYRIIRAERGNTINASSYSSEVGEGLTRFSFDFESL